MAGFYRTFTRTLPPADEGALLTALRGLDATAGISVTPDGASVTVKKSTAWTSPQITSAQNAIDTAPARTPQTAAQNVIDNMPIFEKAIILTILDETNRLRTALRGLGVTGLPNIDVQTMIGAVRTKAGSL